MFGFLDIFRSNPSKIRDWANRMHDKQKKDGIQNLPVVQVLSDSIIWSVSRFGNPNKNIRKNVPLDKMLYKSLLRYAGDLSLFEWACFVYYTICCWHDNHKVHEKQDNICAFLLSQMIEKFESVASMKNLKPVVINRFELYSSIPHDKHDYILFYLKQLMQKSDSEGRPTHFAKGSEPVIIGGIDDDLALNIELSSQIQGVLPNILETIEKFYKLILD